MDLDRSRREEWAKFLSRKIQGHEFRHDGQPRPGHGGDRAAGEPHRRAADRPGLPGAGPGPAGEPDGLPRGARRRDPARRSDRSGGLRPGARRRRRRSSTARRRWATGDRWREFQVGCIDATRTLAEASARAGVDRFVHISSTSAYGHPPDQPTPIDETAALGQNVWVLDHYTRSKVECERLLWDMADAGRLPLTVIRPSWLFGERDRTTIPRLIQEFRWHRVSIVGKGDNPLSAVYAGVVADAALLAADDPGSVGEAYNITSHCRITQREFLDMLADALGVPRVTWHYPVLVRLLRRLLARAARAAAARQEAAAGHPLRGLAAGPIPRIQHREGPHEARLDACPVVSREPSSGRSAGSWKTSPRGCPTTRCRRWCGSARGSGGSERERAPTLALPAGGFAGVPGQEPAERRPGSAGGRSDRGRRLLGHRQDAAEADVGQPLVERHALADTRRCRSSRPP